MNDNFAMALDSIRANTVRSVLTVLGVVIGVATVTGMSSVISGLNENITSQIEDLGSNLIFVTRFDPVVRGRRTAEERTRENLTMEHAEAIARLPAVRSVAPTLRTRGRNAGASSYTLRYGKREAANTIIEGVTPDHEDVFSLDLAAGRWISQSDHDHRASVLIIGYDTAESLFVNPESAVGKRVDLEGRAFNVIGVLEKRPGGLNPGSNPEDNLVELPIRSFQKLHPEVDELWIALKPVSQAAMLQAVDQVEGLLRRLRGVRYDEPSDFAVFTQDLITDFWNQISSGVFAVMIAISSVALVVGGVGVMNVMLVSVTERTREIGIRKAVGATRREIMSQFLLEAMVLTSLGGVLGLLAGAGLAALVRNVVPYIPAAISLRWGIIGFSTAVTIGLIFGVYPAYKAARLDPIDALRYE